VLIHEKETIMANATTQAVWRSLGGDQTKTAYAGTMLMAADFFIPSATAANTTAVRKSASNAGAVILPAGAVVKEIQVNAAATGGTNPTFDLGWIGVSDATALDVDGLVAEGDADVGKAVYNYATATAGDDLGVAMSTTQMVKITGGVGASAATGGSVTGVLFYYVPTDGSSL